MLTFSQSQSCLELCCCKTLFFNLVICNSCKFYNQCVEGFLPRNETVGFTNVPPADFNILGFCCPFSTSFLSLYFTFSFLFCFHFSSFVSSLSVWPFVLSLYLREEVTKLKFEAKTFHVYANQKEVCICIIKTMLFCGLWSSGS